MSELGETSVDEVAPGVEFKADGAVGRITLTRPEVSNAIDIPAAQAFGEAVALASSEEVRAVLLTGQGKRFCVGGDVASFAEAGELSVYIRDLATLLEAGLRRLSELDKPVVLAVQGVAAGAGLAFVLSSGVVVAARSATFVMAYAGIALTPDCGVSYLLPRAVGQQRALELALTGRRLMAQEAVEWGLITEVATDDGLMVRAAEIASELAAGPSGAYAGAKHLMRSSWDVDREVAARNEIDTIVRAARTAEAVRLIEKFTGA